MAQLRSPSFDFVESPIYLAISGRSGKRDSSLDRSPDRPTQARNCYDVRTTRHFLVRPDWRRGKVPMSYDSPIATDYWDDDRSAEWRQMMQRIETEGMVLEP